MSYEKVIKVPVAALFFISLLLFSEHSVAQKCFDITGCCPTPPSALGTVCTVFGCHSCDGVHPSGQCPEECCLSKTTAVCCPKKCKKKRGKRLRAKAVVTRVPFPSCKEPIKKIKPCPKLFEEIIECKVIFPGDLEDNLCRDFKRKLMVCEPGVCFAPYAQDPTFRTTWQILGRRGGRCVVASNFEDVGLRDRKDKPIPITLTCEYDKIGVIALIKKFNDMDNRYYHFTTCERGVGIHNCTITSAGKPISKVKFKSSMSPDFNP